MDELRPSPRRATPTLHVVTLDLKKGLQSFLKLENLVTLLRRISYTKYGPRSAVGGFAGSVLHVQHLWPCPKSESESAFLQDLQGIHIHKNVRNPNLGHWFPNLAVLWHHLRVKDPRRTVMCSPA